MFYRVLLILLSAFLCVACAQTTTRTSTGETVELSIEEVFSPEDRTGPSGAVNPSNAPSSVATLPGIDQESFQDFNDFKSWLRATQPGTPEFAQFQLWREYLEYIRVTNE